MWGFELAHNDGPHEALDAGMLATLQAGYDAMSCRVPPFPCVVCVHSLIDELCHVARCTVCVCVCVMQVRADYARVHR